MKQVVFEGRAFGDFNEWAVYDKKIYQKIIALIKEIDRNPFVGIGKPEALKHDFAGYWSRRITDEHRLVYKMSDTSIIIASCKYHYEK
jgi:toxin YoeB